MSTSIDIARADLPHHRAVILLLAGVWVEDAQRYLLGWSDARVAEVTGEPEVFVAELRAGAFGAEPEAGVLWRLRQAVVLIAQRFDPTVETELRDGVAERQGRTALEGMVAAGVAPPAGMWDTGWSDDRVAELVGIHAGHVRELRESLPWVPPVARPEARRQRLYARLGTSTPAARVLRLAEELNPTTGRPYTTAGLYKAMQAAGEIDPQTPGAKRRELDRIGSTIAVGRAIIDLDTGQHRSAEQIAARLGVTHAWVRTVLARFEGRAAASEGRPSLLTAEVCARLERADPQRFDRRSIFRWSIGWIWLTGKAASLRTVKGWRAAGVDDQAAGKETLPARFQRALASLIDRAPAVPVLPSKEALEEAAGRWKRRDKIADTLGITLEQLAEIETL